MSLLLLDAIFQIVDIHLMHPAFQYLMIIMIAVAKFCEVPCCGLISGHILWLSGPVKC